MHQAVHEDKRTSPHTFQDLPGFAFVSLNYEESRQLFRDWGLAQAEGPWPVDRELLQRRTLDSSQSLIFGPASFSCHRARTRSFFLRMP